MRTSSASIATSLAAVGSSRGADLDLVLRETTVEMLARGPGAHGLTQVVEIEGCGHAPALNVPDELDRVSGFIKVASRAKVATE